MDRFDPEEFMCQYVFYLNYPHMNFLPFSLVGQKKKLRTQLPFINLIVSFDRPCMSYSHSKSSYVLNSEFLHTPKVMIFMKISLHSLVLGWRGHSSLRGHPQFELVFFLFMTISSSLLLAISFQVTPSLWLIPCLPCTCFCFAQISFLGFISFSSLFFFICPNFCLGYPCRFSTLLGPFIFFLSLFSLHAKVN